MEADFCVRSAACGDAHTMFMGWFAGQDESSEPATVYGTGLNTVGQLGLPKAVTKRDRATKVRLPPAPAPAGGSPGAGECGSMAAAEGADDAEDEWVQPPAGLFPSAMCCGGHHSFVMASTQPPPVQPYTASAPQQPGDSSVLFLGPEVVHKFLKEGEQQLVHSTPLPPAVTRLVNILELAFSSPSSLNCVCLTGSTVAGGVGGGADGLLLLPVDLHAVRAMMITIVSSQYAQRLLNGIGNSTARFLGNSSVIRGLAQDDAECLHWLLIVFELPLLLDSSSSAVLLAERLSTAILGLGPQAQAHLRRWWSAMPSEFLSRVVQVVQAFVSNLLTLTGVSNLSTQQTSGVLLLDMLYQVNEAAGALDTVDSPKAGVGGGGATAVGPILPYERFYNEAVSERVDLRTHYRTWKEQPNVFSVCRYPFLFTPAAKSALLGVDSQSQMSAHSYDSVRAVAAALVAQSGEVPELSAQAAAQLASAPYLLLAVRRERLVDDALDQLAGRREVGDLKRPLRVVFVGEEGQDEGAVKREFINLLMQELLGVGKEGNGGVGKEGSVVVRMEGALPQEDEQQQEQEKEKPPHHVQSDAAAALCSIFSPAEEGSSHLWFNTASHATPEHCRVLGMLIGLAVFNGVIINAPFMPAVFRQLLVSGSSTKAASPSGDSPERAARKYYTTRQIQGYMQSLAHSLDAIMRTDGPALSSLDIFFEACIPAPSESKMVPASDGVAAHRAPNGSASVRVVELVPGGCDKKVTVANRAEFVDAYLRLLLDDGVRHLSEPLCEGFHAICDAHSLDTLYFRPEELEQLLCGHREWSNLLDLEKGARYIGFDSNSPIVRAFWSVVHDRRRFPKEKQRRLLWFATGSDRVPIRGLADLQFTIQRSSSDDQRLPSAHACFNMIDLPEYSSLEVLATRLDTALEHAQGFGLV